MHELSLCGAIADITTRRAADRRVEVVHLRIGQLRQVVPEALEFCWSMLIADTELDGTRLSVEYVPALLRCRSCAAEQDLGEDIAFACRVCGGLDMAVVTGEEFLVVALDLAEVSDGAIPSA